MIKSNRLTVLLLLSVVFTTTFGQTDFKTKKVTVFKTGVALFEKEARADVINNSIIFNKLPFGQEEVNTNNDVYQNPNTKKVVNGTVNFEADKNSIQEVHTMPSSLRIMLEKNQLDQQIKLKYLQNGLMWIPSYNINLNDDVNGTVTLNATILNDIEDIENIDLNLAVGYPYFPYSYIQSPLTEKTSVPKMLELLQFKSNNIDNYNSQFSLNDVVVIGYGETKKKNAEKESSTVTQQSEYEDLFFYSKRNFSIRKNEVVNINLIKFDIKYKDSYSTTIIPTQTIVTSNGVNYYNKPKNVVWHSILFENTSNSPLTSGIAYFQKQIQNEIKYLSQGQIKHTAKGDIINTAVSISPDIEINDYDSVIKDDRTERTRVLTIQGEIEIKNSKNKTALMIIDRTIFGELLNSEITWEFQKMPNLGEILNSINNVRWSIQVDGNSTKKLKYTYKVTLE